MFRFSTDENNQKTTSRIASASANILYHRILDTSTPRTCSEFASLRDAIPYERHICRGLFDRTLLAHNVPLHTSSMLRTPDRRVHGYYYRRASAVRYGNTPAYFRFCKISRIIDSCQTCEIHIVTIFV